jgi:hypothetical protein
MSHKCPGPGEVHSQGGVVPDDMLACSRHWYTVPRPLRNRVWAAWRDGDGAGTPEHNAAIRAAVAAMTTLPPSRRKAGAR